MLFVLVVFFVFGVVMVLVKVVFENSRVSVDGSVKYLIMMN